MIQFRRRPKAPLNEAIALMQQSLDMAWDYLQDRQGELTEAERAALSYFHELLWEHCTTSHYLMRQAEEQKAPLTAANKLIDSC